MNNSRKKYNKMKISYSMPMFMMRTSTGYGNAGFNIVRSLQQLGHKVPYRDPEADVELCFSQPHLWEWSRSDNYKIGYFPFESTELPADWPGHMESADEIWVTSPWFKTVVESYTDKPVRVYEHGVDSNVWVTKRRQPGSKIKFLHHGEPAQRKGGQMALDAFRSAFGNRRDVHLTIKAHQESTVVGDYDNVSVITREVTEQQLVELYHDHDVMVYPSWGEGFGLIPLQAMATGMPTICTEAWAPYQKYLLPPLRLKSELVESPWPDIHPGKAFKPDFDHLVESYKYAYDNFDTKLANAAHFRAGQVAEHYNWLSLTENAFDHIVKMFT